MPLIHSIASHHSMLSYARTQACSMAASAHQYYTVLVGPCTCLIAQRRQRQPACQLCQNRRDLCALAEECCHAAAVPHLSRGAPAVQLLFWLPVWPVLLHTEGNTTGTVIAQLVQDTLSRHDSHAACLRHQRRPACVARQGRVWHHELQAGAPG